jgi:hypothetical protein
MGTFAIALGVLLCGSSAFAAQNVGNTSQKGSLLIFPQIDVSPGWDTLVRISNDANTGVDLTCYYMNERKGRRDFHIRLTRKQPIWFSVSRHAGTFPVAAFPTDFNPLIPGNVNKGMLACWATDVALAAQISHNHLSGTATVGQLQSKTTTVGTPPATVTITTPERAAFTYPSWNFTARGVAAGANVGTPGRLDLTGVDGAYDACPSYLIGHFTPRGVNATTNFGGEFVTENFLSVASCNLDFKQDYVPHFTKLKIEVWNEQEVKFTGSFECSDSTKWLPLSTTDVAPENFDANVVQSVAAQLKVKGVASTQCPPVAGRNTENSGLVGVLSAQVFTQSDPGFAGTSMNGAGAQAGFILWDAQDAVVPELR